LSPLKGKAESEKKLEAQLTEPVYTNYYHFGQFLSKTLMWKIFLNPVMIKQTNFETSLEVCKKIFPLKVFL
jgi:hypothetical protein